MIIKRQQQAYQCDPRGPLVRFPAAVTLFFLHSRLTFPFLFPHFSFSLSHPVLLSSSFCRIFEAPFDFSVLPQITKFSLSSSHEGCPHEG